MRRILSSASPVLVGRVERVLLLGNQTRQHVEVMAHAWEMQHGSIGSGVECGGCFLFHDLRLAHKGHETGKSEACEASSNRLQRGRKAGGGIHLEVLEDMTKKKA
jgi:hypothetical protein